MINWDEMLEMRSTVNKVMEPYHRNKQKSIDSKLIISAPQDHSVHKQYRGEWVDFFGVSCVELKVGEISIQVEKATGIKCERCGKWDEYAYESKSAPNLCARCDVVMNMIKFDTDWAKLTAEEKKAYLVEQPVEFIPAPELEPVVWWQDEADVWEGPEPVKDTDAARAAARRYSKWIGRFWLTDVAQAIRDGKFKP